MTSPAARRMTAARAPGKRFSPLPGFDLAMGVTLAWVGLLVALPLTALTLRPWELGIAGFVASISSPRVLAALRLSFGVALGAAAFNVPAGLLIAWVLVRTRFAGRRLVDAMIDLPFALPTAVAGIAFTALYAPNGWVGGLLAPLGIQVAYDVPGIAVALVFVGLPYMVRTLQPVLADLSMDVEDAAATLGATRLQVMWRVILPVLAPAAVAGFAMAFARAVGEYGSVIFIAGNMPGISEIAPLLIVIRLEQFDYAGAAALGLIMLLLSFAILGGLNLLQRHLRRHAS
jgi:sulfate transport system permease protein